MFESEKWYNVEATEVDGVKTGQSLQRCVVTFVALQEFLALAGLVVFLLLIKSTIV